MLGKTQQELCCLWMEYWIFIGFRLLPYIDAHVNSYCGQRAIKKLTFRVFPLAVFHMFLCVLPERASYCEWKQIARGRRVIVFWRVRTHTLTHTRVYCFFSHFLDFITFTFYDLFAEIAFFPPPKRENEESQKEIGVLLLFAAATVPATATARDIATATVAVAVTIALSLAATQNAILWQIQSTLLLIDSA